MKKKNNQKGFTLIEMMIVIAIIGMLAGILLFAVNRSLKKTRATQLKAYTKQLRDTMLIAGSEGCTALQQSTSAAPAAFADIADGTDTVATNNYGCGAKEMTWKQPSGCDSATCITTVVTAKNTDPCVISKGFENGVFVCSGDYCECEPTATTDCSSLDGADLAGGCSTVQ